MEDENILDILKNFNQEDLNLLLRNMDLGEPRKVKTLLDLLESLSDNTYEERKILIQLVGDWILLNVKDGYEFEAITEMHDTIQNGFNSLTEQDRFKKFKNSFRESRKADTYEYRGAEDDNR